MQMHVQDYDAGKWTAGEPAFLRKWKAQFLRRVSREYTCDACKSSFPQTSFAIKMLDNATSLGRKLVCARCQEDGFSPKDCTAYSCTGSISGDGSHAAGHQAFAPDALSKWKRGLLSRLRCKACRAADPCITTTDNVMKKPAIITITSNCMKRPAREGTEKRYKCDACQERLPGTSFGHWILKNARHHGRKLVCMACAKDGYSPKDCRTYECIHGERRGHLKFKPQTLKNSRRRKYPPTCIPCGQRRELLLKKLYSKGSWRCKCPQTRNRYEKRLKLSRRHWFVDAWLRTIPHELYCPLSPQADGEKRWEGKNKGITEEDVKFLLRATWR